MCWRFSNSTGFFFVSSFPLVVGVLHLNRKALHFSIQLERWLYWTEEQEEMHRKWKSQDRQNSPNIHSLYHKIGSQVNDRAPWIRPGFGSCLSHSRAGSARNVISIATVNHYSVHELIDWMMMNAPIMQQSRVWGRCSILYLNAHLPLFVAFVLFVALLLFLCTALRKCLWLFVPVRSLAINAKLMFHTCWSFSERVKNSLDHIRTQRVCVCVCWCTNVILHRYRRR